MSGGHASFCGTTITPFNLGRNGAFEELLIGPLLLPCRLEQRRQGLLQLGEAQLFQWLLHASTSTPHN
jgi:hypothetical protein